MTGYTFTRIVILAFAPACIPHAVAQTATLFAAETSLGVVQEYPAATPSAPTSTIGSFSLDPGTQGAMVVDSDNNLFVTDPFSTWVYEYAPGATTPSLGYPTSMTPEYVAVDHKNLYVFQTMLDGGTANILVYPVGTDRPSRTLSDSAINAAYGMAIDGGGNVFVAFGTGQFSYGYGVFVHGQMPMHRLGLATTYEPTFLMFDAAGNLLVVQLPAKNRNTISVFPPGKTVAARTLDCAAIATQLSFTQDGKGFYTANYRGQAIGYYAYPSCRHLYDIQDAHAYPQFGFSGVAVAPALPVGVWLK